MRQFDFPITECPKCGGGNIAIKQYITGYGTYYVDLKSGEIESSGLHDGLDYKNTSKYAICADCGKRLFKVDNNLNVLL